MSSKCVYQTETNKIKNKSVGKRMESNSRLAAVAEMASDVKQYLDDLQKTPKSLISKNKIL